MLPAFALGLGAHLHVMLYLEGPLVMCCYAGTHSDREPSATSVITKHFMEGLECLWPLFLFKGRDFTGWSNIFWCCTLAGS